MIESAYQLLRMLKPATRAIVLSDLEIEAAKGFQVQRFIDWCHKADSLEFDGQIQKPKLLWDCPPHHKRDRCLVADTDAGRYMARKNDKDPFYTASVMDRNRKMRTFGATYTSLEQAQDSCQGDWEAHNA